jgi:hypothetical protein
LLGIKRGRERSRYLLHVTVHLRNNMQDFTQDLENIEFCTPKFEDDDLETLRILRGQEIDELVDHGFLPPALRFDDGLLDTIELSYSELKLCIQTGNAYPAEQLSYEVKNLTLSRLVVDALKVELRHLVENDSKINNYEIWVSKEAEDSYGVFQFQMSALKMAQVTTKHLTAYRNRDATGDSNAGAQPNAATLNSELKNDIISPEGVDFSTLKVDATAVSILGKTVEQICETIPSEFRILHIESVLRNDLKLAFWNRQQHMRENLESLRNDALRSHVPPRQRGRREDMIAHLVQPQLTFHGTSSYFVPSIVQHGFLCPDDYNPETGKIISVRCGSTYGRGIYSSPNAGFSMSYSGEQALPTSPTTFFGLKLIVCATIMGRKKMITRQDDWRLHRESYPGSDSHVANQQLEYIVFDKTQILPCYVIHLDFGKDNEQYFRQIPNNAADWRRQKTKRMKNHEKWLERDGGGPGYEARRKEELKAQALKWFPYGYGTATGTSFKIEEIGEISDDDEDYGEYQEQRLDLWDRKREAVKYDSRVEDKQEHDEYFDARLVSMKKTKSSELGI